MPSVDSRPAPPVASPRHARLTLLAAVALAAALPGAAGATDAPARIEDAAWLEDASGALGPAEVAALPAAAFHPLPRPASAGFGRAARWIRLTLAVPPGHAATGALVFEFPLVEALDVWVADASGGLVQHRGGLALAPADREVELENATHVLRLTAEPGTRRLVLLRVETRGAGFLGVRFLASEDLGRGGLFLLFAGGGLGALLLLMLMSARVGLAVRWRLTDREIWAFLALQAGHLAIASGVASSLLDLPPGPTIGVKALLAAAATFAGLRFIASLLGTAERAPRIARLMRLNAVAALATGLIVPVDMVVGNVAVTSVSLASLVVSAAATLEALLAGERAARLLLPGLALFSISTAWYCLSLLGLAPPSPLVVLAEIYGAALIGSLLAAALASRDEREAGAQRDRLEALVAERTRTLSQAAEALRIEAHERFRAEERFRIAFKMYPAPVAMARLDDGRFIAVNDGFARIHGVPVEAALGKTAAELGLWIEAAGREPLLTTLRAEGAVRDLELRMRGPAGEVRTVLLSAAVVPLDGVPHVLSVSRDVTEARAADLRRARLEHELHQSQKLEALGRLAAGVAHDFNNLLTAISANVGLTLDGLPADHPDREPLQEVIETVGRAAGLTGQLLAFTRRQPRQRRAVALDGLVHGMGSMLGRLVGEEATLELRLHGRLPPVSADPGQLEQVLLNLVVNARDAVAAGGVITVSTGLVEVAAGGPAPPGSYVRLSVEDDGAGMDPETRARIFEPFFTTKDPGRGTGLGLATVYGVVQQHGGRIHVQSEQGRGSRFEVLLPALAAEDAAPPRPALRLATPRGDETVLVVDDTPAVRDTAAGSLRRLGYRVHAASGGREALEVLAREGTVVALLLTDVRMPEMDGPALAAEARRRHPGLRVLFMTGYGGASLQAADVEAADVVEKPFTLEELGARVREALDRSRGATPGQAAGG